MATAPKPALFAQIPDHGHVVIEASAGTGKTYTIERLVVDLLLRTGCTIDQILVVTFTVRATHELKIRIRRTIEDLLELPPPPASPAPPPLWGEAGLLPDSPPQGGDVDEVDRGAGDVREADRGDGRGEPVSADFRAPIPPQTGGDVREADRGGGLWIIDGEARALLTRALAHFDTAAIYTIHAFCQKVLRDHAFACGRPLEQTVVDPHMAFTRAFRVALRSELARSPQLRSLLGHWLTHRSVEQLEEVLFRYHRQQGEFRPRIDGERLDAMSALAAELSERVQQPGMPARIVQAYETAELNETDLELVREMLPPVIRALTSYEPERWGSLVSALNDLELNLLYDPRPAYSASFVGGSFCDGLAPEVRAFADGIRALHPVLIPLDAAAVQWFLPTVNELLAGMKAREGWLDHDDMLVGVRDALRSARGPELARALRSRYRFALIDEFQDTDLIQWEVFQRVFVDGRDPVDDEGQPLNRKRIFIIGDPKQAIYSFRGGDVVTYLHARDVLGQHSGQPPLRLRDNYRSTERMVTAQNLLFDPRAEPPLFTGSITHDEPARCARPELQLVHAGTDEPVAPLQLIEIADPKDPLRSATVRRMIGRRIAREIRDVLGDRPLELRRGDEARPIEARDIFVLTRTNFEAEEIAGYLREQNVPFAFFKRDGLFQTNEALDVRDLLTAVAHPNRRSARIKAWYTPFFGVELAELRDCADLPDTHPLISRLFDWHTLARNQQYERLFARLVSDSGILRREIFFAASERQLTNYLHIFEILLDEVARSRGTLDDLVTRLSAFIDGRCQPPGIDGNVQRLESERAAVQIMTVHKAKGLEAPLVYLFGGFTGGMWRAPFIYHAPPEADRTPPSPPRSRESGLPDDRADRRDVGEAAPSAGFAGASPCLGEDVCGLAAGQPPPQTGGDVREADRGGALVRVVGLELPADPAQRAALEREQREEDQRLLYVAATRAAGRVVLPFYRHDDINGRALRYFQHAAYEQLRARLEQLLDLPADTPVDPVVVLQPPEPDEPLGAPGRYAPGAQLTLGDLVERTRVKDDSWLPRHRLRADEPLREWHPPAELLALPRMSGPPDSLRYRRFVITSYSRMKAAQNQGRGLDREAPTQPEVILAEGAVPGGAAAGAFLHDLLERVPFESVRRVEGREHALDVWSELPEVAEVFDEAHFRHGFGDFYRKSAEELVFTALRAPVQLDRGRVLQGLARADNHMPEVEFFFPIPEVWHQKLDQIEVHRRLKLVVERGWVKGFIDLVFEVDGRVYFLDWKSDVMADFGHEALARHVDSHYGWQARLYALAIVKMLQAHDEASYEQRFGGMMYCFLRGMDLTGEPNTGVYFARPSWRELLGYERALASHRRFG